MNDVYAIRCFRNGKRKLTCRLTRSEAAVFRHVAKVLIRYLSKTYRLNKR